MPYDIDTKPELTARVTGPEHPATTIEDFGAAIEAAGRALEIRAPAWAEAQA